jgi:hypothetical protein
MEVGGFANLEPGPLFTFPLTSCLHADNITTSRLSRR